MLKPSSASNKKLGQELYLDKQLCDVKIFCQDKIFYCHKLILSLRSEVFKRMLTGNNMIEATRGEINATKASAVTMEALLYFMYNYSMDEHEITVDLLVAADYYMVPDLVNQCIIHLASNLTEENATEVMMKAYLIGKKDLFHLAYRYVHKKKLEGKTLDTEAWENMKMENPKLSLEMMTEALFNPH